MRNGGATVVDGADHARPLARGRHGIPRDLVLANQRRRLFNATNEVIAERGYAALIVSDVIDRAGVSRATFYEFFKDKHDCVLAAQRQALDSFLRSAIAVCAAQEDWPQGVVAAVEAALDFTATSPGAARLIIASSHSPTEPRLARRRLAVHRKLVELLRAGSRRCPEARTPGGLAEEAAVGAAISIVGTCLATGEPGALAELRPELVQIVLTPYLGGEKARRIALAA